MPKDLFHSIADSVWRKMWERIVKAAGLKLPKPLIAFGKKMWETVGKAAGLKPPLFYLEFHLADHCNLNCKGCGHFSPIVEKQFPDLNDFKRDMKQLQRLFSTIHTIVLMGGEPLLNPQIDLFLFATRSCFPKAKIQILTNGILLPQMSETFWNACRSCSVDIDITIYPPLKEKESDLVQLVKRNGLRVLTHSVTSFHAFYNRKGDTDKEAAFKRCRDRWYTPMLREGKIYICPKPATLGYFNKKYDLKIPRTGFVDIYTPDLSGWDVRDHLDEASSTCCYCTLGWDVIPVFSWETTKPVLQDWMP
jgi:organic radical activating enzyme